MCIKFSENLHFLHVFCKVVKMYALYSLCFHGCPTGQLLGSTYFKGKWYWNHYAPASKLCSLANYAQDCPDHFQKQLGSWAAGQTLPKAAQTISKGNWAAHTIIEIAQIYWRWYNYVTTRMDQITSLPIPLAPKSCPTILTNVGQIDQTQNIYAGHDSMILLRKNIVNVFSLID